MVLLVCYLTFAGINAAHYAMAEDEGLDYMAKIARLLYIGVVALFLQALFIYWFYLVRTTLKRRPSKQVQKLLNRAQVCVIVICFFCISGGAAYGWYEASEFDSPAKAPTLVYTIVCCSAGVVDEFILFLTMIRIKLTETKKPKKKQQPHETMMPHQTVDATIQDRARGVDTKILE
jgi:membrane-associated HD superfamily phosphohydrolase